MNDEVNLDLMMRRTVALLSPVLLAPAYAEAVEEAADMQVAAEA